MLTEFILKAFAVVVYCFCVSYKLYWFLIQIVHCQYTEKQFLYFVYSP